MSKKEERDKSDACMDAMHEQVEDMKSAEDALDYLIWLALNVVRQRAQVERAVSHTGLREGLLQVPQPGLG